MNTQHQLDATVHLVIVQPYLKAQSLATHPPTPWRIATSSLTPSISTQIPKPFLWSYSPDHSAWVLTYGLDQAFDFHIWQSVAPLHQDYNAAMIPLFTAWDLGTSVLGTSVLLPVQPSTLLAGLCVQATEIHRGLLSWRGSSIAGPDAQLVGSVAEMCAQLDELQVHFAALRQSANNWRAQIRRLFWPIFWTLVEEQNHGALMTLHRIRRCLNVKADINKLFEHIHCRILLHRNSKYQWLANILEATEFSSLNILRTTTHILPLVERAVRTLLVADYQMAGYRDFWQLANMTDRTTSYAVVPLRSEPAVVFQLVGEV
ncbi:hypothetical protein ACHAQK_007642 [Fusarium lateritium]